MADPPTLRTMLSTAAAGLGFAACGVSLPDAAMPELGNLMVWLAQRYNARLDYMARRPADRCSARSLLPGCQSVIVVARRIDSPAGRGEAGAPFIAGFAQDRDYHTVISAGLEQLSGWLSTLVPDQRSKIAVDSSPILEKAFALSAGIGWRGKNSLVLNECLGSSFMLGLLLTTAQIEPDEMLPSGCGGCQACLDACPVGALVQPGVLDAGRCISYQNGTRQAEPGDGASLHGWLYGCDLCQQACPFNAAGAPVAETAPSPAPAVNGLRLEQLPEMDEAAFTARFAGTVIENYGLERLKRNARLLLERQQALSPQEEQPQA